MLFGRKTRSLKPDAAADALDRGELVLVDVRSANERAGGKIAGSLHVPLDQLSARFDELPAGRQLAFVCKSGVRSASAARLASGRGADAVNVRGGMLAWKRAGLPVETGG